MFRNIIRTREPIVGLDIGTSSLKLVQLDLAPTTPALKAVGTLPMPAEAVQGNSIKNPQRVADAIRMLWEQSKCSCRNVSVALPGGSVFVKPIKVPLLSWRDLREQVVMEAAQFIPYDRNSISIDFHVLRRVGLDSLEVLVVAAKKDILAGYLDSIGRAGLQTKVVDVDYFALQNCFEYGEPEQLGKVTAIIDIGARFSTLHIVKAGGSMRMGDVSVGVQSAQASEQATVSLVAEIEKQLSLLCTSEDEEIVIDSIRVSGGGATLSGFTERLADAVQVPVRALASFSHLSISADFHARGVEQQAPFLGIAVGLALRCPGDHLVPEYLE